ncbi:hypothetical protein VPH35_030719 [Triticum aestivum]
MGQQPAAPRPCRVVAQMRSPCALPPRARPRSRLGRRRGAASGHAVLAVEEEGAHVARVRLPSSSISSISLSVWPWSEGGRGDPAKSSDAGCNILNRWRSRPRERERRPSPPAPLSLPLLWRCFAGDI